MALQGFDKSYYLNAKLEQLQNDPETADEWAGQSIDFLESKLQNGFGLTAEEHYQQYGYQEGLAPNDFFDSQQYIQAKATALFNDPSTSYLSVDEAADDFVNAWGGNVYEHYLQHGAEEGINPSNAFDASAYLEEKLAALQAAGETQYQNAEDVREAFADAGFTPLGHFLEHGQEEGLTAPAVAEDEQVNVDPVEGENFSLTTGLDDYAGTDGADTIKAVLGADATLNPLDTIDGGASDDTLTLNDIATNGGSTGGSTLPGGLTVSNVETVNARSAGAVDLDISGFDGVETFNVVQGDAVTATAGDSTDVNVSGVTGNINVDGGADQTVTTDTTDAAVDLEGATGAVNVTHDDQDAGTIAVDGGTDVTVNATADNAGAASGTIDIGQAVADDLPSGAVNVTQNLQSDGTGGKLTGGDITATGGSTVDITVNANSVAEADDSNNDITVGAIAATAGDNTTDVTVTQNDNAETFTSEAVAAVPATQTLTFKALTDGEATVVDGLTFTASQDLTAEQVAQAFANLDSTDTQSAGGVVENGVFTGELGTAGWTSGDAEGAEVVFTAPASDSSALKVNSGDVTPDSTREEGTDASGGVTSTNSVTYGDVTVDDNANTASVKNVTLNGYTVATLGGTNSLDALETLSLANSAGAATLATAQTALDVTVNNVDDTVSLDGAGANVTDLTLNAEGEASTFALTAAEVTDLTVNAAADLDVSDASSDLGALETATISGAGDVALGDVSDTATTIAAADATGGVSVTVAGDTADVTTGSGNDSVTVDTADISEAIALGAGDDTLTLSAATANVPTASVDAGEGTDTIAMTSASAQALDDNTNFANAIAGFEQLTISNAVGSDDDAQQTVTVDLEALGFDYVTSNGTVLDNTTTANSDILQLDNMANGGTLAIAAAAAGADTQHVVNVIDAATNASDSLNVSVSTATADLDAGTLTVADVETVNVTSTDSQLDNDGDGIDDAVETNTLALAADSATTIVADGNANLDLGDLANSSEVTTLDASALEGNLTVTANGNAAMTVTGGAGDDELTAAGSGDVLNGGAGDDTLEGDNLSELTGGEGDDTFAINVPSNVNSYSTITDLEAGDTIDFGGTAVFSSAQVELADTAVFQDYANEAVNQLAGTDDTDTNGDFAWFQFGGDTFIVGNDDSVGESGSTDFQGGADSIIKIDGEFDLSMASYNQDDGTLQVA